MDTFYAIIDWLGLGDLDTNLVIGILVFFGIIETLSGHFKASNRTSNDWIQEVGSFFILSSLVSFEGSRIPRFRLVVTRSRYFYWWVCAAL